MGLSCRMGLRGPLLVIPVGQSCAQTARPPMPVLMMFGLGNATHEPMQMKRAAFQWSERVGARPVLLTAATALHGGWRAAMRTPCVECSLLAHIMMSMGL